MCVPWGDLNLEAVFIRTYSFMEVIFMKKLMLIVCLALSPIFGVYAQEGKYNADLLDDHETALGPDVIKAPTAEEIAAQQASPRQPARVVALPNGSQEAPSASPRPSFICRHPAATAAMATLFLGTFGSYLISGAQLSDLLDGSSDAAQAAANCWINCHDEEQRVQNAANAATGILASFPAAAIAGLGTYVYSKIKQAAIRRLSEIKPRQHTAQSLELPEQSDDDRLDDEARAETIALCGKTFEDQLDQDPAVTASITVERINQMARHASSTQSPRELLEEQGVIATTLRNVVYDAIAQNNPNAFALVVSPDSHDQHIVARRISVQEPSTSQAAQQSLREKRQRMLQRAYAEIFAEAFNRATKDAHAQRGKQQPLEPVAQPQQQPDSQPASSVAPVANEGQERSALLSQYGDLISATQSDGRDLLALPVAPAEPVAHTSEQASTTSEQPNIIGQMVQEVESNEQWRQGLQLPEQPSYLPEQQPDSSVAPPVTIVPDDAAERLAALPSEPMHEDPMFRPVVESDHKQQLTPQAPLSQQPAEVVEGMARDLIGAPAVQPKPTPQQQQAAQQAAPAQDDRSLGERVLDYI
jgi:hypothetical protein